MRGAEGTRRLAQWKLRLLNTPSAPHQILRELEDTTPQLATPASTSGTVEATCKSLVQVRVRRSGARWRPATAQVLLSLRALALSDRWDSAISLTLAPLHREARRAA